MEDALDESTEAGILMSLQREIRARMPADPIQKLETELDKAVEEERYEDAAVLREPALGDDVQSLAGYPITQTPALGDAPGHQT